jgi:hypothetical protein
MIKANYVDAFYSQLARRNIATIPVRYYCNCSVLALTNFKISYITVGAK